MQFPVPQFTEVEDKLIGPLSIKQFGIIFVAGIFILGGYSATKSTAVLVVLFVIFGVPALALAFAKINGRPIYKQMNFLVQFLTSPKFLVFHKESSAIGSEVKFKDAGLAKPEPMIQAPVGDTQSRIREVQSLLEKQEEEERKLIKKM